MSYADIKTRARRDRHQAFAVPVSFYPKGLRQPLSIDPPLTARLHSRVAVGADPLGGGYAQIVDGVTRVLFNREQLQAAGVLPKNGDRVVFGPPFDTTVKLDIKDTPNGPIVEKWSVSRT